MEPTFETIKEAAERFRGRFYSGCQQSRVEIADCETIDDIRHLCLKYRNLICIPLCANYIMGECSEVLEALGLHVQRFIDGRIRLYLVN